jgi:diacylglycerol kinase (ATP)
VTPAPTTGPRTAGAIARTHIERGADLIIVAGGDGTINEAVEGMIGSDVPLAILPAGTANVLATEMKLGRDPVSVVRKLNEMTARRVPVGRVVLNGGITRHFLLMAGIGLDAHIVHRVNASLKARTGKFAYWVAGWSLLGRRLAQLEVTVDGTAHPCSFALITKVRNYGGDFEIARSVTLMDDRFEVILFQGKTSFEYVKYFAGMAVNRVEGMRGVTVLRACRLSVRRTGEAHVYVQIDGEFAGEAPAEVSLGPGAVRVLVPERYGASRG